METLERLHGPGWLTTNKLRSDLRDCWQTESETANDIENAVKELLTQIPAAPCESGKEAPAVKIRGKTENP